MRTVSTVASLRQELGDPRRRGWSIGFVPTMGFLHAGHAALIAASRATCDITVVSIFVNPTQFAPYEDFEAYPRDADRDADICRSAGVDLLFCPKREEVYPSDAAAVVDPGPIAQPLCGAYRPGHFRGVATVVAKLFNMVHPSHAFFGQKDFQQCAVVRTMVRDLNFKIQVEIVSTVREPDGLALSSRNVYLSEWDRLRATRISAGLFTARDLYENGERDRDTLLEAARKPMQHDVEIQYLELVDAGSLVPSPSVIGRPSAICVAGFVGGTRLIDNVLLSAPTPQWCGWVEKIDLLKARQW